MKIKSVRIKNYHSIIDCEFKFPDLLALVGENNVGKSNIIYGLNLFFSKERPRDIYSFNNPSQPIEITIEFGDLTKYEKDKITEDHRTGDKFILKKIYKYNSLEDTIEKDFTSVKDGKDTNIKPRGFENVLSDILPEFYLLPAVKYCSEEIKMIKTTNFSRFLDLIFQKFDNDFQGWDVIIDTLKKEAEKTDENAPLIKIAQEISQVMKEQFSSANIKLKPKISSRADVLKNLDVFIDDDCDLPLLSKGQGAQRAFIFAILRLLAKKINEERPISGKEKKDIIIAIEEPELYLHPHQQKIVYSLLKQLSQQTQEQIQIIYSTHSSFMVHVEDYKYIGIVKKPNILIGTKIFQYNQEIFPIASQKEFQLLCQFDPERNELFFARKIIFVEGDTEKFSLPIILDKLSINVTARGISMIECGSRAGIKLFLEVVNKFNQSMKIIDFLVMHDKDPLSQEDQELQTLCGVNPIYIFDPDFEREIGLQVHPKNKPYWARKEISVKNISQIPVTLKNFFISNL